MLEFRVWGRVWRGGKSGVLSRSGKLPCPTQAVKKNLLAIPYLVPDGFARMQGLRILTASEQVAAHLREALVRGFWNAQVPGVNGLARDLGVANETVETALRLLEREGLLVGQPRGQSLGVRASGSVPNNRHSSIAVIHSRSSPGAGGRSGTLARISARSSIFGRATRCSKVSRTFQAVTWEERAMEMMESTVVSSRRATLVNQAPPE